MWLRHYGLRPRDLVFRGLDRQGTPYGEIVFGADRIWFEPAQGFDLASQDWPPPVLT